MPQLPLHGLHVRTRPDHETRGRVPQVMDCEVAGYAGTPQADRQPTVIAARITPLAYHHSLASRLFEQQVAGFPVCAQSAHDRVQHDRVHDGAGLVGLGVIGDDDAAHHRRAHSYIYTMLFKIDVHHPQGYEFAPSHAA